MRFRPGIVVAGLLLASCALGQVTPRARAFGYEARQLWVDASANWNWLVDAGKIAEFCKKAKAAGFNELILDAKPIVGRTLYPSGVAGELGEWKGIRKPPDLDIVGTFIRSAHAEGLRCMLSANVFSEGHGYFERAGAVWEHPEWASMAVVWEWTAERGGVRVAVGEPNPSTKPTEPALFTAGKLPSSLGPPSMWMALDASLNVTASGAGLPPAGWRYLIAEWTQAQKPPPQPSPFEKGEGVPDSLEALAGAAGPVRLSAKAAVKSVLERAKDYVALFVSPLQPDARRHEVELICEMAGRYPVDGIVLDRMRFEGIENGFGPAMRDVFAERYVRAGDWPGSILEPPPAPGMEPRKGRRWADYAELRATLIRDFLLELRAALKKQGAAVPVGVYVGSWYDIYEGVGVNWASDALKTQYAWADPEYRFTGYAGSLDFLCAGAYYRAAEKADNPSNPLVTVAGACDRAVQVAGRDTFVYGTIYLNDYRNADELRRAVRAARSHSLGIGIFDASYVLSHDWWGVFAEEFRGAASRPPHSYPSLLGSLRRVQ